MRVFKERLKEMKAKKQNVTFIDSLVKTIKRSTAVLPNKLFVVSLFNPIGGAHYGFDSDIDDRGSHLHILLVTPSEEKASLRFSRLCRDQQYENFPSSTIVRIDDVENKEIANLLIESIFQTDVSDSFLALAVNVDAGSISFADNAFSDL